MQVFDEKYYLSNYPEAILRGRKPLHNRFWIRCLQKLKPRGALLDIGCGEGFFLKYAEKYYEAYGVDISEYAIDKARERCESAQLYVKNIRNLDLNDQQFDIIVCFDVLEHLDQPGSAIREFNRLLKHEGLLIISVPNMRSLGRLWKRENWHGYRDPTHVSLLTRSGWTKLLRDAGFKIIDIFYDGLWDSPYSSMIPSILQHFLFKFPSTLLFTAGIRFPGRLGETVYMSSIKERDLH